MQIVLPDAEWASDPAWTAPLAIVAAQAYGNPRYQFFDRADFFPTAKFKRSSRPDIVEYQHAHTRGCLLLDREGIGYRYVVSTTSRTRRSQFRRHKTFADALDAVCLWHVPWKKPGFERYQFGNTWEERWTLHPNQIALALSPQRVQDRWYDDDADDDWQPDRSMFREPPRGQVTGLDGRPRLRLLS